MPEHAADRRRADPGSEVAAAKAGELLALEAQITPWGGVWSGDWAVTLPLRAEHITIDKQTVVVEEVMLRRSPAERLVRLDDTVRHEELRLQTEGEAGIAGRAETGRARNDEPARPGTPTQSWRRTETPDA
jgi:hypothetical protein